MVISAAPLAPLPRPYQVAGSSPVVPSILLVDGENIDHTLGDILGRKPASADRPRWSRILAFVEAKFGSPCTGLFFANGARSLPGGFTNALRAAGFQVVSVEAASGVKVVDEAINLTLAALVDRPHAVVLASHDGDFADRITALADGTRPVALLGFTEFFNGRYGSLRSSGRIRFLDLESDATAFATGPLPRVRTIPLDRFDPLSLL